MKRLFFLLILFFTFFTLKAQLKIVNSIPNNGATNVALNQTISITFSKSLDTLQDFHDGNRLIGNIPISNISFTNNNQTLVFSAQLQSNTDYSILLYSIKAEDSTVMRHPGIIRFTTAATFSGYNVSGNVTSNDPNLPLYNSFVALTNNKVNNQSAPKFSYLALVDSSGSFTFTNVKNGVYYPLSAIDLNYDGSINPGFGDAVGLADSITVANADITDLTIAFQSFKLLDFNSARTIADSISQASLPSDATLYIVRADDIDSTGRAWNWDFSFATSSKVGYRINVSVLGNSIDTLSQNNTWFTNLKPLGANIDSAAQPDSFVVNAWKQTESIRNYDLGDTLGLHSEISLGNLARADFGDMTPNIDGYYWGLSFTVSKNNSDNWGNSLISQVRLLANYQTGQIIKITGVNDNNSIKPENFALNQNYPNPFNPATTISYTLPETNFVTLTIYNILGQPITVLVNKEQNAGTYHVRFDASKFSSGIYFYTLSATGGNHNFIQTKKMILLK